jgi:YVTN family beta-propeller protein
LTDPVRVFDVNQRLHLEDEVQREITQRILRYDPDLHRLYLVRLGETDDDPSVLQIIDPTEKTVVHRMTVGLTSADLLFDAQNIYVANFDSESVSVVDKTAFAATEIPVGRQPLRLCRCKGAVYVISQADNTIQEVRAGGAVHRIPNDGRPDNLFVWRDRPVIVSHNAEKLFITLFDPGTRVFTSLHETTYPYGDVRFDTGNVSFYVRGQFGDAVFDITRAKIDAKGRLWITDFLAGRLFIIEDR